MAQLETNEFEWFQAYPEHVRRGIEKLARAEHMSLKCPIDEGLLHRVAMEYDVATDRRLTWDSKTQTSRDSWLERFEKVTEEYLSLLDEGPCPASHWGFPSRGYILMALAEKLGVSIPDPADADNFYRSMFEFEDAADEVGFTLSEAVKHHRRQVVIDAGPRQLLNRPGNDKAARADFIISLYRHATPQLSTGDVACIASVLFDDEAIDDSTVRRYLRNARADFG